MSEARELANEEEMEATHGEAMSQGQSAEVHPCPTCKAPVFHYPNPTEGFLGAIVPHRNGEGKHCSASNKGLPVPEAMSMEAKARLAKLAEDTWAGLYEDDSGDEQIAFILKALTEAHNAGMKEAAKVADGFTNKQSMVAKVIAAAIREKINGDT